MAALYTYRKAPSYIYPTISWVLRIVLLLLRGYENFSQQKAPVSFKAAEGYGKDLLSVRFGVKRYTYEYMYKGDLFLYMV